MKGKIVKATPNIAAARIRGFTIPEILTVVAVVAILGMIAIMGYQDYNSRARAADIVVKYDAIRSGVGAELAQASATNCDDLAKRLGTTNLKDEYARLDYGFEAVAGGFRPVLNVCAKADANGPAGIKVARGAHDTMVKTGRVERGAVLTDSVVSFALPLTDSGKAVCVVAPAAPKTACGDSAQTVAPAAQNANSGMAAPVSSPSSSSITCPAGQTADSADPAKCKAAPPSSTNSSAGLPPSTQHGTSGPATAKPPEPSRQQCTEACRVSHPHGNSRAYRDCLAICEK
jgi:prepilin-type N-terminal cleavage/methylation domain-containing protein